MAEIVMPEEEKGQEAEAPSPITTRDVLSGLSKGKAAQHQRNLAKKAEAEAGAGAADQDIPFVDDPFTNPPDEWDPFREYGVFEEQRIPMAGGLADVVDFPLNIAAGVGNIAVQQAETMHRASQGLPPIEGPGPFDFGFARMGAEGLGLTVPESMYPQNFHSRGLQFLSEGVLTAIGFRKFVLQKGFNFAEDAVTVASRGKVKQFFITSLNGLQKQAREKPKRYFFEETSASYFAGVGHYIGEELFPDSPWSQLGTTLVGGTTPQFLPTYRITMWGKEMMEAGWHTWKGTHSKDKAFERIFSLVDDPEEAAKQLLIHVRPRVGPQLPKTRMEIAQELGLVGPEIGPMLPNTQMRPADIMGIVDLQQLARTAIEQNAALKKGDMVTTAWLNSVLQTRMKEAANGKTPAFALAPTEKNLEAMMVLLDKQMDSFQKYAFEQGELGLKGHPEPTLQDTIAYETRMFELYSEAEGLSWKLVQNIYKDAPRETRMSISDTLFEWNKDLSRRSLKGFVYTDVPEWLTKRMGGFRLDKNGDPVLNKKGKRIWDRGTLHSKGTTMGDILDFRSRLMQAVRDEVGPQGAGDRDKVRYYTMLAKQLKVQLEQIGEKIPPGVKKWNYELSMQAIGLHYKKYGEGLPQKLLHGIGADGIQKVNPQQTIGFLHRGDDSSRALNVEHMQFSLGKLVDPEGNVLFDGADEAVKLYEGWIARGFNNSFIEGLTVNSAGAKRWMVKNERLLNQLPTLKKSMQRVIETGDVFKYREKIVQRLGDNMRNPKVNLVMMILEEPDPRKMFETLAKSKNPEKVVQELLDELKHSDMLDKDFTGIETVTGEALEGLQYALMETLRRMATMKSKTRTGEEILSGGELVDIISGKGNFAGWETVIGKILNFEQRDRLNNIALFSLTMDENREIQTLLDGIMGEMNTRTFLDLVAVFGAKLSNFFQGLTPGGSTIQVAGIGASRARDTLKSFLKNPPEQIVIEAIIRDDKMLYEALTRPLRTKADIDHVSSIIHAWQAVALYENERIFGGRNDMNPQKIGNIPVEALE